MVFGCDSDIYFPCRITVSKEIINMCKSSENNNARFSLKVFLVCSQLQQMHGPPGFIKDICVINHLLY